jgi:Protein of unknown function (DUF3631)
MNAVVDQTNLSVSSAALDLLSAALDPSGYIVIVGLKEGSPPIQRFFVPGDYQGAVAEAMTLSGRKYNAYFATSTYLNNKSREAKNANAVRTFKLDLDVAIDDARKYPSKSAAVGALAHFCTRHAIPVPVLVDSGHGVHAYWPLTEALTTDDGKLYSEKLKTVCIAKGLLMDVTVPGDIARILRVPGTMNYKHDVMPRPVKLKSAVVAFDVDAMLDLIDGLHESSALPEITQQAPELLAGVQLPAHLRGVQIDKTTRGLLEGKPKLFVRLLERSIAGTGCAQIANMFQHQAQQDEPRWHAGLSVAYFCNDGEEAIHTLSSRHPEYDYGGTQFKAQRSPGPRTCSWFKANYMTLCEGCQHDGKITSPIQLAMEAEQANESSNDDNAVIARLAGLSRIEYDRVRVAEAKKLRIRTSVLDAQVNEARDQRQDKSNSPFVEVEPCDEPINLASLLTDISLTIRRFIVCDKEIADAGALWAAMTWVVDALKIAPLAVVTAPEKRCGKSEFRRLMAKFVRRPLEADGMSASVLFRGFDLWKPTLLVDEFDTFVADDEDLRGIFNAGHQRGGCIWRCVGDDHEPKRFDVFGPKLLAGIGKLPETMMDRAIVFELRRKLPNEEVERLRYADETVFEALRRKLARFAEDNFEAIGASRPTLPDALNDRQQDNWETLLAVADLAGTGWSEIARAAALKLSAEKDDAMSMATELLTDVREIFVELGVDRIFSTRLVSALCRDDRRWSSHYRGMPITSVQVARILKGYGIGSKSMRIGQDNAKGYTKDQFTEAWTRYLPPAPWNV